MNMWETTKIVVIAMLEHSCFTTTDNHSQRQSQKVINDVITANKQPRIQDKYYEIFR